MLFQTHEITEIKSRINCLRVFPHLVLFRGLCTARWIFGPYEHSQCSQTFLKRNKLRPSCEVVQVLFISTYGNVMDS